ncbi:copper amine oxidase N-terminal domain-containing protein [Paenibacillus aurantius]|uniref:Copper amine oxidase N-terminal domain-containing protein n=1 Tax=Paenibacillus aurantius TaxID=2918900 RepID=A0AA96LGG3_9BACL|nr:copper amine oxidase N-terminal domain-containing protein [Paenibacillus aurantius]WNQ11630.1 copper amine oxidase N-terminal domain-containing protein [Paenibacillus aurantius]
MKKTWAVLGTAVVSMSVLSATAWAAPKEDKGGKPAVTGEARGNNGQGQSSDIRVTLPEGQDTVTSVTYSTYGHGHNGYKGLENAYEHVKGTPAEKVIANLLKTKYGIDVQADVVLSDAASELDASGDTEAAVDVQKEAVKANPLNLDSYKQLGKLLKKLGVVGVKAYVNGEEPAFEVRPFIKEGNTLVPFRAISESLKADVTWNNEERSVTVVKGDITIKLFIGSTTAYVNGKAVTLEVAAEIKDGSTMVPVRFVSESLKAKVDWDQETLSAIINGN